MRRFPRALARSGRLTAQRQVLSLALIAAFAGLSVPATGWGQATSTADEAGAIAEASVEDVWLGTESVEASPGSVVWWEGALWGEVAACTLDERPATLLADGVCLLPIDLLDEGELLAVRELQRTVGSRVVARRRERIWIRVGEYGYPEQHIKLSSNRHVDLSDEDGARAAREAERIKALWSLDTPRRFELPLGAPLERMPAGGRFGSRRWFNGQPRSPHTGADYAAGSGTPVLATADGTVALAEEHFFGGRSVFVDHGGGLVSMALHLSEIDVEPGQQVHRGQVIGKVGSTGRSTGPHLHFGLRLRGARVDPELLLRPPVSWGELRLSAE